MRRADDFADLDGRPSDERLKLLANWRKELHHIFSGEDTNNPVFIALADTIDTFKLSIEPFDRLLDAFEFDATGNVRFKTWDDLRWYTARSAEPVGELVLALFGYSDEKRIQLSNEICTGLQLLNFIQDLKEDVTNNRFYFPKEDLATFGLGEADIAHGGNPVNKLVIAEAEHVSELLRNGNKLPGFVRGRLSFELRAVLGGAERMLAKIREIGGDVISHRPKLSKWEHATNLLSSILH
jgi:squalene synthase HpnC